ncbi:hypothetical protein J7K93_01970 [bacterium]|nr:hypothetical protein [bacterium]
MKTTVVPKYIITIILLGSALLPLRIFGQSPFSGSIDSLICRGIDQTLFCQFDSAMSTFKILKKLKPDNIAGNFYLAATLQSKMMDFETTSQADEFYSYINRAIDIGETAIEINNNDSWTLFYLGSSYTYKGMFQVKEGALIKGFVSAKKGMGYLHRAVKIDSSLWDAYLGIGNYDYWSGRFYKYLKWLPWIKDKREQGVRLLELAVNKGTFSKWIGINSLAWVEYDRKHFFKSLILFRRGINRYPRSRFFQWGIADCLFKLNDFKDAAFQYLKLLKDIKNRTPNYGYNEAEIRQKLMLSYFGLGLYEECIRQADLIIGLNVNKETAKRIKKHRKLAKEYKKRCIEKQAVIHADQK